MNTKEVDKILTDAAKELGLMESKRRSRRRAVKESYGSKAFKDYCYDRLKVPFDGLGNTWVTFDSEKDAKSAKDELTVAGFNVDFDRGDRCILLLKESYRRSRRRLKEDVDSNSTVGQLIQAALNVIWVDIDSARMGQDREYYNGYIEVEKRLKEIKSFMDEKGLI